MIFLISASVSILEKCKEWNLLQDESSFEGLAQAGVDDKMQKFIFITCVIKNQKIHEKERPFLGHRYAQRWVEGKVLWSPCNNTNKEKRQTEWEIESPLTHFLWDQKTEWRKRENKKQAVYFFQ